MPTKVLVIPPDHLKKLRIKALIIGKKAIPTYRISPGARSMIRTDFLGYNALFVFIENSDEIIDGSRSRRNSPVMSK